MNKKKFTIIQLVGMLLFIAIVASASYAFFAARIIDDENSQAFFGQAANLELIFEAEDTLISGEDIYPGWKDSANFKLINKGTPTYYTLYIKNIVNNFTIPGSIYFEIISDDGGGNVSETILPIDVTEKDLKVGILIGEKTTHNYTINVYYNNFDDIDQEVDTGKDFSFEISIKSSSSGVIGGTDVIEVHEYAYTGAEEVFIAPKTGIYKIEAWGASGGINSTSYAKGQGAYTSGFITLTMADTLYINVGQAGSVAEASSTQTLGGYNGGGAAYYDAGTGGGASDVRFQNNTLYDRIIVAGAGGGSGVFSTNNFGGSAGGLTAYSGGDYSSSWLGAGDGGTQTSGGTLGSGTTAGTVGSFGLGGKGGYAEYYSHGAGAGGAGYFGGAGGSSRDGGGGGGSSYITGHTGCVAITSSSSAKPRTGADGARCATGSADNLCSVHYSGKKFTNTVMIDGEGYAWTSSMGSLTRMPKPNGGNYASGVGHSGNGFVRITYNGEFMPEISADVVSGYKIQVAMEENDLGISAVSYCINQSADDVTNCEWIDETSYSFITSSSYEEGETYYVHVKASDDIIYHSNSVFMYIFREDSFAFVPDDASVTTPYVYVQEDDLNWRVRFLTTGTLTFDVDVDLDIFLVGGGGGAGMGAASWCAGNGGGGGYNTLAEFSAITGSDYKITIGAGGAACTSGPGIGSKGKTTYAFGFNAEGGGGGGWEGNGSCEPGGNGGSGGGGRGGYGGSNGSSGTGNCAGTGSGINSYEFRETESGILYGGGGAGRGCDECGGAGGGGNSRTDGGANTGGGGGGAWNYADVGGDGGSGIVVIRNKRL